MRAAELLSECPRCRVEGALVELVDLSGPDGVTLSGACRLCAYAVEAGDVTHLGEPFVHGDDVLAALGRWAAAEGEVDVAAFVAANFLGARPGDVAAAVLAGQGVATSFDVIGRLFPGMGGGRAAQRGEAPRLGEGAPVPTAAPEPAPAAADPRDVTRALTSVAMADGVLRAAERAAVTRLCARLGAPAPIDADWHVWRPNELGAPDDAAALFSAMREVALCDGEADPSEARVLREYARAWGLPAAKARLPKPGALAAFGRAVAGIVGL